ncbi:hypothetical protein [Actinopolymorpha pittospori]|uniref:Uncharacterized protein n=1 Tax=Actinopolymorpha pittospori TaxID=648752 RepID=A0A927MUG5_9ACTN|nr:hypothetical protein [Actinopolymorpha pittospori]MBE1606419.1 hypothetical protein [Actinopolymorpha pittospori]
MPGRSNRVRAVENVKPRIHQRFLAQLLLACWRWLPETFAALVVVVAYVQLEQMDLPPWAAGSVLVAPVTLLLVIPPTGRVLVAWFWVDVTRHRLRTFMSENGLRNRSGRLPWLALIYPTAVGERAWMVLVGGISCTDVEERLKSLGSTCYARDGQVVAHRKWSHLIRIDITRRDPLDSTKPVRSRLLPKNTPPELLPPSTDTPANGAGASQWAIGIGLPLNHTNNNHDTHNNEPSERVNGQENPNGLVDGMKAIEPPTPQNKNQKESPKKKPSKEAPTTAAAVLSASGEDVSDYV